MSLDMFNWLTPDGNNFKQLYVYAHDIVYAKHILYHMKQTPPLPLPTPDGGISLDVSLFIDDIKQVAKGEIITPDTSGR